MHGFAPHLARLIRTAATIAALALACCWPAHAAASDEHTSDVLQQMQRELEKLREDNQSMRSELNELRLATGDNWLTEKRAEEIRMLVTDVLADADARASLMGDGLMAGWRDGFFLASHDGRFMLNLQGYTQFRYVYSYKDEPNTFQAPQVQQLRHAHGFENARTRLTFRGHVFDRNLQYMIRGNFAREGGNFSLLDSWMRYHLNDEWSIRAGQFKLPFSREYLVSAAYQQGVERSLVGTNTNIGYSQGIELTYADNIHRVSAAYSDGGTDNLGLLGTVATGPNLGSGVAGHPPINRSALLQGVEYAWTVRYEFLAAGTWRQFEDFTSPMDEDFGLMFGVAAHYQRDQATGQLNFVGFRTNTRWFAYTVDASAEFGGANLFAAFTHHYVDSPQDNLNIFGVVAQGGVYLTPKWEAFARYEFGTWSLDIADFEDLHLVSVGVNYYLDGHDAKWTTDIGISINQIDTSWTTANGGSTGWRIDSIDTTGQVLFRTQFQLMF